MKARKSPGCAGAIDSTRSTASYLAPDSAWISAYEDCARPDQWPHSYSLKGVRVLPS